jgi:hypothetical protein
MQDLLTSGTLTFAMDIIGLVIGRGAADGLAAGAGDARSCRRWWR